jgi:PQQ-dependent dehydrogenase (methanol/ethanol family)
MRGIRSWPLAVSAALAVTAVVAPQAAAQQGAGPAPGQPGACCAATNANVPKVGGDYGDQNYSDLTQLRPGNLGHLAATWRDQFTGLATRTSQESTPVAVDGDLYLQTGQGDILAIGGATGRVVWEYSSGLQHTERGVAIGDGRVYSALGARHVVALNEHTGALLWTTQVGTPGQDTTANQAQTPWALYYNGLVLVGTENGGTSNMRGHLYALNAATGAVVWSFATTAAPGQPGSTTWTGNSWMLGGGDAWIPPAIDPQLGLIYLTAANPEPRTGGGGRAGDDLYTSSLVALRASTGKLVWYFQSVHHDLWDYDNTMYPVVADVRYGSATREVVVYGSKSAWLYYLDASTGKPVIAVHEHKEPQLASQATSPTQPIPDGDPLVPVCPQRSGPSQAIPDYLSGCEFTPYLSKPVLVTPGWGGGANWAPMSFDRKTGLLYVAASESNTAYSNGQPYGQPSTWAPLGEYRGGILDAVNPQTNKIVWQISTRYGLSNGDGLVSTSSGLLFQGSPSGFLYARAPLTGKVLWQWQTGEGITTTPVTYSVRGVQYVAIFGGSPTSPATLTAFRLGGRLRQSKAPAAESSRVPIQAPVTAGSSVANTVVLGRVWDAATNSPGTTENLASETAMSPEILRVAPGTTVRFVNPKGNVKDHCAESFFDPTRFKIGPLAPGQSGTYRFVKRGDYFYNDCAGFPWNTGEVIVR